jgi:hypothetical protein
LRSDLGVFPLAWRHQSVSVASLSGWTTVILSQASVSCHTGALQHHVVHGLRRSATLNIQGQKWPV